MHSICLYTTYYTGVRGRYDGTPLQFACWGGTLEVVQYLAEELKCNVGESLAITTVIDIKYMNNYECACVNILTSHMYSY